MADDAQYLGSFGRVSAGTADTTDYDRTVRYAKQAGSMGDRAREALAAAERR